MRQDRRWKYFKCQQCGKCCAEIGLPYDPKSIFKIAEHLDLTIEQVIDKYYGRMVDDGKAWEPDDRKRTPCPFLKTNRDVKFCLIYAVRPSGCRLYPFDTDFGRNGVECAAAEIVYARLREEKDP
jgi:Fe-S-cluster containining protein